MSNTPEMSVPVDRVEIGKVSFRVDAEGWWTAYYMIDEPIEDSVKLGSIHITLVAHKPERKQAFIDLMRNVAGDLLADIVGIPPEFGDVKLASEAGHS